MNGWMVIPGRAQAREGMRSYGRRWRIYPFDLRLYLYGARSRGVIWIHFLHRYLGQTFVLLMRPTDTLLSPEGHTRTHTAYSDVKSNCQSFEWFRTQGVIIKSGYAVH